MFFWNMYGVMTALLAVDFGEQLPSNWNECPFIIIVCNVVVIGEYTQSMRVLCKPKIAFANRLSIEVNMFIQKLIVNSGN